MYNYCVMELNKKLIHLLADKRWSQAEAAKMANISQEAFSSYIRIKEPTQPGAKALRGLSRAFGVTVDYLLNDSKGYPPSNGDRLPEKTRPIAVKEITSEYPVGEIPIITKVAANGSPPIIFEGGYPTGETGETVERPPGLQRPYAAIVSGDSLEPGIPDNAKVIADPRESTEWERVKDGDIVIAQIRDKGLFIKKIHFADGAIFLTSNVSYRAIPITKVNTEILHKVIWVKML